MQNRYAMPGSGGGGGGMGPPPQQRGFSGMPMGGGPMPMPGGQSGGPQGGGPQPMPKPQMPGGGGGGPGQPGTAYFDSNPRAYAGRMQQSVDDANMALRRAQIMGANPMQLAELEQAAMNAQRSMNQWQTQQYGERMGEMSRRGPGPIGGGPGQSQLEQNPYLAMLLQNQLGMGGGRGGSPTGGLSSIGHG